MTFQSFSLEPRILKALTQAGYTKPTPIQSQAIPIIMGGADIRGSAQTGTGKTAAFLLPALHKLATTEPKKGKGPRLLVLVPTRELGMQIAAQVEKYGKYLQDLKMVSISGGIPYQKQLPKLRRPYDVLIATPGRLIDFMQQKAISLSRVEILVLDEADRMLDMGFVQPVEDIIAATPSDKQTLMFSATLEGSVRKLSQRILVDPTDVAIHQAHAKHESIDQTLHYVDNLSHKNSLLDEILADKEVYSAIVFTSTRRHANQLVLELKEKGHDVGALHGDLNQRKRTQTINSMRKGHIRILVATDVAARGIDIDSITHVINFDLPQNPEDYVHRIGRTGRAGAKGKALSFASGRDKDLVRRIEKFTKQPFVTVGTPKSSPPKKKFGKKPYQKQFSKNPHKKQVSGKPRRKHGFKARA